jgi:predicted transposase YdaD
LLVVTASGKTARWASEPIVTGPGGQLLPLVVGPEGVPVITDPERAKQDPELAVLSVMAHGHGDVETAVKIALSAATATAQLDEDTRVLYSDLIEAALSEAARKAFAMLPQGYEFQGPTYKKAMAEGRREGKLEGKAEGKLEGKAEAVLTILQTRGLLPSDAQRERILACHDLDSIKAWIAKAVTTPSVDALFDE